MSLDALAVVITDTHLNHKIIDLVENIFDQAIGHTIKLGLSVIYHAGDVFDSRKHQTLATLKAFARILKSLEDEKIVLRAIPGNHDKPDYFFKDSYLDIYREYESLELVRDYTAYEARDYMIHMIPFFDEKEVYGEYIARSVAAVRCLPESKHILITHVAINGVKNNDGSEIEDTLGTKIFSSFEKVLVGHYHDKQDVGNNIKYIGSAYQKDFGENNDKGLSVIYTDGSIGRILLDFPEFKIVKLDLNKVTKDSLGKKIKQYADSVDNIRFKFSGTKEKIAALDRQVYAKVGIDIKVEQDDPEIDIDQTELSNFTGFDKKKILEEWVSFGEKHTIDEDICKDGEIRLKNSFKNT